MAAPERAEPRKTPPKIVYHIERAEEFRRLLDTGLVRNQADLARTLGLTRARVTQLLQLLDLHPDILAYAKTLPPGTPTKMVTERGLRPLLKLTPERQLKVARQRIPGFAMSMNVQSGPEETSRAVS
jgi:ParB-like chromosome segregation protein Spo0J